MAKAKNTPVATGALTSLDTDDLSEFGIDDEGGAGPQTEEEMPGSRASLHGSVHDSHEAERRYDGDVHNDGWGDWSPPSLMEAPEPLPGMRQRWVRFDNRGEPDVKNRVLQERNGWRPRRLDTVPEGERQRFPVVADAKHGDVIKHGELVLCHMPKRLVDQRNEFFRRRHDRQMASLPERMAQVNAMGGHGIENLHVAENRTRVTTRKPIVQADGG